MSCNTEKLLFNIFIVKSAFVVETSSTDSNP